MDKQLEQIFKANQGRMADSTIRLSKNRPLSSWFVPYANDTTFNWQKWCPKEVRVDDVEALIALITADDVLLVEEYERFDVQLPFGTKILNIGNVEERLTLVDVVAKQSYAPMLQNVGIATDVAPCRQRGR